MRSIRQKTNGQLRAIFSCHRLYLVLIYGGEDI